MPVDFHGRKEQASGGVGGGEREFAKNLRRERSSFLFLFCGRWFSPFVASRPFFVRLCFPSLL